MVRRVTWLPIAREELGEVVAYIKRRSPQNAKMVAKTITAASRELALFPRMGPRVPEFGEEDHHRERHVHSYRLIYRITPDDNVLILAVWHAARLLPRSVKRRH